MEKMSPFWFLNFKIMYLKMIIDTSSVCLEIIWDWNISYMHFHLDCFFLSQTEIVKYIFNFTILFCFSFPVNTFWGVLDYSENLCIFTAERILTYWLLRVLMTDKYPLFKNLRFVTVITKYIKLF